MNTTLALMLTPGMAMALSLKVNVQNMIPNSGSMAYALFSSGKGFPEHKELALKRGFLPIPNETNHMSFELNDLAAGEYAMLIYQDKNNNLKLDKNFLGIPREPVGASNNPANRLGPPRFRDCTFQIAEPQHVINIKMVD